MQALGLHAHVEVMWRDQRQRDALPTGGRAREPSNHRYGEGRADQRFARQRCHGGHRCLEAGGEFGHRTKANDGCRVGDGDECTECAARSDGGVATREMPQVEQYGRDHTETEREDQRGFLERVVPCERHHENDQ